MIVHNLIAKSSNKSYAWKRNKKRNTQTDIDRLISFFYWITVVTIVSPKQYFEYLCLIKSTGKKILDTLLVFDLEIVANKRCDLLMKIQSTLRSSTYHSSDPTPTTFNMKAMVILSTSYSIVDFDRFIPYNFNGNQSPLRYYYCHIPFIT